MHSELRQEVEKLISARKTQQATNIGHVLSALQNRAFSSGSATVPTNPTAGMTLIIAATKLKVRGSGIFRASFTVAATGLVSPHTYEFTVNSQTAVPGITLTNGTQVGPGTLTPGTVGTVNGAFVSNMAAGITVAGGGGTLLQADSLLQVVGTASTTCTWDWSNLIQNSIALTVETPFTVGNEILVTLSANFGTATSGALAVDMDLQEQP